MSTKKPFYIKQFKARWKSTLLAMGGILMISSAFGQNQTGAQTLSSAGNSASSGILVGTFSMGETFNGSTSNKNTYGVLGIIQPNIKFTTNVVDEKGYEHEIIVYPNPTFDYITVETKMPIGRVHIYNSSGQRIKTVKYNSNKRINLQQFTEGLYLIQVETDQGKVHSLGWISKQ